MKKVSIAVVGVLALAASANAQGTWYTDQALWLSRLEDGISAGYNALPSGLITSPYTENSIIATATGGFVDSGGALSTNSNQSPIIFNFNPIYVGNGFGGLFGMTSSDGLLVADGMNFSIDGSTTNVYSLTSTTGYTFLGYVSDTLANISVTVSGDATPEFVSVDEFFFVVGTNPTAPGAAVPEPGTVVSMGLLGAGVLGLVIRSRRRMSN
jgi:hypothetical protein